MLGSVKAEHSRPQMSTFLKLSSQRDKSMQNIFISQLYEDSEKPKAQPAVKVFIMADFYSMEIPSYPYTTS